MKKLFFLIAVFLSASPIFSQSTGAKYSSLNAQVVSASVAAPGKRLLDFKSQYYDAVHQLSRSFVSRTECYNYFTTTGSNMPQIAPGQKVWIDSCGALNTSTGILTPGCPVEQIFGPDLKLKLYLTDTLSLSKRITALEVGSLPVGAHNIDAGLAKWRYARDNKSKIDSGGVDIVIRGNSIAKGYNADTVAFNGWSHLLKVKFQEKFNPAGVVGGYGFVPLGDRGGQSVLWQGSGNLQQEKGGVFTLNGLGVGGNDNTFKIWLRMNGGLPARYRMAADGLQVLGIQWPGYGTAVFDISQNARVGNNVGSGVQTGTYSQDLISGGIHSGNRWGTNSQPSFANKITLNPSLDNYLQLSAPVGSGTNDLQFDGAILFNGDFNAGNRFHDLSFYGIKANELTNYVNNRFGGANGSFNPFPKAALTILEAITNNVGTGNSPNTSLSVFLNAVTEQIQYLQSINNDILYIIPQKPTYVALDARTTVGERYVDFHDGLVAILNQYGVAYWDANEDITLDALPDNIHLSNLGNKQYAESLYKILAYSGGASASPAALIGGNYSADTLFLQNSNGSTVKIRIPQSSSGGGGSVAIDASYDVNTQNFLLVSTGNPDRNVTIPNYFLSNTLGTYTRDNKKLGVGTSAVAAQLHVSGTGNILQLENTDATDGVGIRFNDPSNNSFGVLGYGNSTSSVPGKLYYFVNGAIRLTVDNAGNFGLNTTSPSAKFHVVGNSFLNGNVGVGKAPTTYALDVNGSLHASDLILSNAVGGIVIPDTANSNTYRLTITNGQIVISQVQ